MVRLVLKVHEDPRNQTKALTYVSEALCTLAKQGLQENIEGVYVCVRAYRYIHIYVYIYIHIYIHKYIYISVLRPKGHESYVLLLAGGRTKSYLRP